MFIIGFNKNVNFGIVAELAQEISHTHRLWPFPGCYLHQRDG